MDTTPSPVPDDKRLDYRLDYRDVRWLVDQLRQHHGYIAGLTGDGWCRICGVSLVEKP